MTSNTIFEFSVNDTAIIIASSTNFGFGESAPQAGAHFKVSDVDGGFNQSSNANQRNFVIENNLANILQLVSDNAGAVGTGIFLTNMETGSDGRHWTIQNKGTDASNEFRIGYIATINNTTDIGSDSSEFFNCLFCER